MRFSRLRLLGFKSFVDPAEIVIERGLTGIVGPNGCGKSNLVEALRWVMGENSYKNMRASGMDDVIFSGSATRPSRNTAEVTLFLDNTNRTAPAAFNGDDDLQVSRRIERESGSVYRINGREARAKDVQLLFADQSTGARSPSMVGQGRIGELIQAKPQARRALLEEAAGISGLHSRRHEAELRLRAAEQNLERIEDVTGELQVQIESLARQARHAQRFRSLSADIRSAEATLLHLRWVEAKARVAEAMDALNKATVEVAERAAAQIAAAKGQAVSQQKLPGLRDAEAAAGAALQRLSIARGQLDEEAKRVAARVSELARRIEQLDADLVREDRLRGENAGILVRLDEEDAALSAESGEAEAKGAESDARVETAAAALVEAEAALASATSARAEAAAARTLADTRLREIRQRRDGLERQKAQAEREAEEIAARLSGLPDPARKRAALTAAQQAVELAESTLRKAEQSVLEARSVETALRTPLDEARSALTRLEAEASTLQRLLAAEGRGQYRPIMDSIKVERGFEVALGAALGDDLDAPLDAAAPAYWSSLAAGRGDAALPQWIVPLSAHVTAPDQLSRRLAQVGVVEAAQGDALQASLRPGQRLVSRDGDLWRWDGFRAAANAPTAAAQRFARKNRLVELDSEVADAKAAADQADSDLTEAGTRVSAALATEQRLRAEVREAQSVANRARDALAHAERAAGENALRQAGLVDTLTRIRDALAEAVEAQAGAESALSRAPLPAKLQSAFEKASAGAAEARQRHGDLRLTRDTLRAQADARARRLVAIEAERQSWITRADNAEAQIALLQSRKQEAHSEAATLEEAPGEIEVKRRALLSELSSAEMTRKAAADYLQTAENRQRDLDRAATASIERLASSRETRIRAEERLSAAEDQRTAIETRMIEEIGVPPHQVLSRSGLAPDAPLPVIDAVANRLDRLKVERERLGAVNLRAEDEQRELSGRLESIVRERDDIIEAVRTLRQAIHELNSEGRERLLAAFAVVNVEFQRLFSHLFGGGTATLELVESDDPLEAGLEIMARPPGKRPQTMTLLSGGEQALTAMALIFAVFLTNPAPICVLDEVDAPLDDHNVERFCNLMDEMAASTETRFMIITHNPITMARMDRLFGVTMAEQGVSQLVSVDLQAAEQMREAG